MTIDVNISLSSSQNEKFCRQICRENQNTHFIFSYFLPENRVCYEITWKNMVDLDRLQIIIMPCMRIVCWITKATDTHSECVIHIAFRRQQRLREGISILRLQYIVCIVKNNVISNNDTCWITYPIIFIEKFTVLISFGEATGFCQSRQEAMSMFCSQSPVQPSAVALCCSTHSYFYSIHIRHKKIFCFTVHSETCYCLHCRRDSFKDQTVNQWCVCHLKVIQARILITTCP